MHNSSRSVLVGFWLARRDHAPQSCDASSSERRPASGQRMPLASPPTNARRSPSRCVSVVGPLAP
eukprot:6519219-Prymnesium_polylepis.1